MLLNEVHLDELSEDDILWKHSVSGHYSAASAYKAQFLGLVLSPMDRWFGKFGLPQKSCSLLGWLSKTGFGPHIDWQSVGGQTVIFAPLQEGTREWESLILQMSLL